MIFYPHLLALLHWHRPWIGLDLFNGTCPSGHISRPTHVNVSQSCLHALNNLLKPYLIVQVWGLVEVNSLRQRVNRRPFADDIFKCIFLNENEWILPRISLKFVPKVRINNIPALVQIMAWHWPGDKPLAEPMMVSLLTHICVTRPQCANKFHQIGGDSSDGLYRISDNS